MWLYFKILILLWVVNFIPPLLTYVLEDKWNTPVDLGRRFSDGRPLLGSHKTFRGVLGAVAAGALSGFILGFPWWLGLEVGFLSMLGDLTSSFVKRRFGTSSGFVVPVLDQGFEGLFPLLALSRHFFLGTAHVLFLLVFFIVGAYCGSLFLNRVLRAKPFDNYPRILRPRVRLKEFRSCQITSAPLRYFVNFEDAFYYHVFMKTVLRLMGVYEKGKHNALNIRTRNAVFCFKDLPSQFENYSILYLSDLHLDGLEGLTEEIETLVKMQTVDLCIIGGDLRMDTYGPFAPALSRFKRLIQEIHSRDGIIAVLGNHDCLEMIEPLEESGVTVLLNHSKAIESNGEKIWIVGVDDPHYFKCHDLDAAFSEVPEDAFSIFVAHSNEIYREAAAYNPRLYLCGHTHGGQIQLPVLGAVFTHSRAPRSLLYGPWQYDGMLGYTSCGVGVSGVPVRFFTQGEVILITLKRNGNPEPPLANNQHWVIS
jgi:predicted MPP superfamily phosphohydrolase